MPKGQKARRAQAVYQLKVTLLGSDPPIWRRILVADNTTLEQLHDILQAAMGWQNCHLHQFFVDDREYGPHELAGDMFGREIVDERLAKLGKLIAGEGFTFGYVYDMGDSWEHAVEVEKVLEPESGASHPACIAGERACPPEDCGGIWGYYELLAIIQDPNDPEHEDRKEWLGDDFDPETFDLDAVNSRLKRARRRSRGGRGRGR